MCIRDSPIIVKPCDASGSRAVAKVEDKTVLLPACLDAIENSISKKALLETYIHGNEYGVESFVYDGKIHVLAVMKKTMTPPPAYAELGHALPAGVPEVIQKRFEKPPAPQQAVHDLIPVSYTHLDRITVTI